MRIGRVRSIPPGRTQQFAAQRPDEIFRAFPMLLPPDGSGIKTPFLLAVQAEEARLAEDAIDDQEQHHDQIGAQTQE